MLDFFKNWVIITKISQNADRRFRCFETDVSLPTHHAQNAKRNFSEIYRGLKVFTNADEGWLIYIENLF